MDGHCEKHVFEASEGWCRTCGGGFCGDCLVYAYGPKKPPFCVSCALSAAGVRSTAARAPIRTRREVKLEMKAKRRRDKIAAKASKAAAPDLFEATIPGVRPSVEFEFTIGDDGSIERPAPLVEDVPEAPVTVPSMFDYEERVG